MLQNRGAYVSAFRRLQLDLRVLLTTLALDNKRYALFVVCFRPALQLLVDDRLRERAPRDGRDVRARAVAASRALSQCALSPRNLARLLKPLSYLD